VGRFAVQGVQLAPAMALGVGRTVGNENMIYAFTFVFALVVFSIRFLRCSFRNLMNALNSLRSSSVHGLSRTVKSTFFGSLISPMLFIF